MDQLKQYLAIVFKYRFWVISGVIAILPVVGWALTTSNLSKEFEDRKGTIDGSYSTANGVLGQQNHPNPFFEKGMDGNIEKLKGEVFDAWSYQYDQQKEILVWPDFGPDFLAAVDKYRPVETLEFPTPANLEIEMDLRELYRDFISEELPKLAEIIDARWAATASAGGGGGDYPGMEGDGEYPGMGDMGGGYPGMGPGAGGITGQDTGPEPIVKWSSSDQSMLQNSRFNWSKRPSSTPTTLDILYAQEDFWILNAVMGIIAETNRDATGPYNAVIKEISYINLGRTVGNSTGQITRASGARGGTGGMMEGYGEGDEGMGLGMGSGMDMGMGSGMDMGMGMGMGMGSMGSGEGGGEEGDEAAMMGMSGMGGTARSPDPCHYRYVDNDYQPIAADRLRTALSPDNRNPEDAFLVVAKRIPIRMGIVMDQRKVHRLISECGNSELMVEVRQVRVNRKGVSGGGMGDDGYSGMGGGMSEPGGGGMGMGMGMGMGPGEPGMGMGMGMGMGGFGGLGTGMDDGEYGGDDSGYGMGGMGATTSSKSPYDLPVEIYGMVYLYNPVSIDKLGIEQASAEDVQPAVPAVQDNLPADIPAAGDAAAAETTDGEATTNS